MGGNPTKAVGLAIGLERLILLLEEQNTEITNHKQSIYMVTLGDEAQLKSMQIASELHNALPNFVIYNDISMASFKSQFKKADKAKADFALILGEEELNNNQVSIKPLKSQDQQQTFSLDEAIKFFKD